MVDRIGNGPGYEYNPVNNERKLNSSATGAGEKFQLDYGKEGAIYEPSSEALKKGQTEGANTDVKGRTDAKRLEEEGVRLTLSGDGINRASRSKEGEGAQTTDILKQVTEWVNKVFDYIKGLVNSIWNDTGSSNEIKTEDVKAEDNTAKAVESMADTKPRTQFEKAKREAEEFLASSEGKKVAKNSDLLTYYDKHGTVVHVSASDKQRILYGDRNQIEI